MVKTDAEREREDALAITCPHCGVPPRELCQFGGGRGIVDGVSVVRMRAAALAKKNALELREARIRKQIQSAPELTDELRARQRESFARGMARGIDLEASITFDERWARGLCLDCGLDMGGSLSDLCERCAENLHVDLGGEG